MRLATPQRTAVAPLPTHNLLRYDDDVCGRFAFYRDPETLGEYIALSSTHLRRHTPDDDSPLRRDERPPSWNIAPTQQIWTIVASHDNALPGHNGGPSAQSSHDGGPNAEFKDGRPNALPGHNGAPDAESKDGPNNQPAPNLTAPRRDQNTSPANPPAELQLARWGLIPPWAKDPRIGSRMINARAESVADKAVFAKPLASRRCLIPVDGFYEWARPHKGTKSHKQPYYFGNTRANEPLFLAGLYEFWAGPRTAPHAAPIRTATIITTAAAPSVEQIHNRMPVALDAAHRDAWLDSQLGVDEAAAILTAPITEFAIRAIGSAVNSVRNDGPHLLDPLPPPELQLY